MSISRTIARPLLASTFFIGATNALKHSDAMAQKAESVTDKLVPVLQKAVPALMPRRLMRTSPMAWIVVRCRAYPMG